MEERAEGSWWGDHGHWEADRVSARVGGVAQPACVCPSHPLQEPGVRLLPQAQPGSASPPLPIACPVFPGPMGSSWSRWCHLASQLAGLLCLPPSAACGPPCGSWERCSLAAALEPGSLTLVSLDTAPGATSSMPRGGIAYLVSPPLAIWPSTPPSSTLLARPWPSCPSGLGAGAPLLAWRKRGFRPFEAPRASCGPADRRGLLWRCGGHRPVLSAERQMSGALIIGRGSQLLLCFLF